MSYNIVFSDIDGTLLNADRELSPATIKAVKRLNNKIPFVLISARMPAAMRHLQKQLEIDHLPIICYNGGLIIAEDEIIQSTEIPLNILETLVTINENWDCHISLYHHDEWYVPQVDVWAEIEINNTKIVPEVKSNSMVVKDWRKEGKGAHKIMAMGEPAIIDNIRDFLNAEYNNELHLYRSKDTYLEIAAKSITKFTAIEYLLKTHFQLPVERAVAFGDNYNDVEMLKHIGYGVAVGNGRPEARAAANAVAGESIKDGVALILNEIFPDEHIK